MTLRIIDGFDYLAGAANVGTILAAQGWTGTTSSGASSTNTAFGYGRSLGWTGSSNTATRRRHLRGRYTGASVLGMRMWVPPEIAGAQIRAYDSMSSTAQQWALSFTQTGNIVWDGPGSNAAQTYAMAFTPGKWFWLEIKNTPGYGTDGALEIRVNTVPVLSLPNITTAVGSVALPATDPGIDNYEFWVNRITGLEIGNAWVIDDLYFLDDQGSINNDYLGNVRAKYMAPVSDYSVQWTIGGSAPAATNWESVLNTSLNDTKYVAASTVGFQDLYGIDPNLNTPFVYGIEVSGAYRMDDATQRVVNNSLLSGSTPAVGVDHYINQEYTFYPDIYELDPATGVSFTGAGANALKIGPKVAV